MVTKEWKKLAYVKEQQDVLASKKKFKVLVAGRGSGKTELARRWLVANLPVKKPWPDPKYFYVLPTADQARRIAWEPIKKLIPKDWLASEPHETRMEIRTIWGSTLYVCSGDKPQRLEGVQWDGGVEDEKSDQKPSLFKLSLLPAMTHRMSWFWMIGVPKRTGIGAADFKELFDRGQTDDPLYDSFTWPSSKVLPKEKLDEFRSTLAPADFREQFEASWENASGLVFQDFCDDNICGEAVYHPGLPIYVGSDFNVDPMAWVLCHFINGRLYVFDEIFLRNTNTQATLKHLHNMHPEHRAGWVFMGDASGRARKTSASASDYLQIFNCELFKPRDVRYPFRNPAVADRVAAANAAFTNAKGEHRVFVNPCCKKTIKDLKFRAYKPETSIIEDTGDIGHISDALTYVIWQLLPLQLDMNLGGAPFTIK